MAEFDRQNKALTAKILRTMTKKKKRRDHSLTIVISFTNDYFY